MHFVGICFGEDWEDNLEYYSEDREVEPYIVYTKEEAIDYAKEIHAKIYENAIENLQNPNVSEIINSTIDNIKNLFIINQKRDCFYLMKMLGKKYKIGDI